MKQKKNVKKIVNLFETNKKKPLFLTAEKLKTEKPKKKPLLTVWQHRNN